MLMSREEHRGSEGASEVEIDLLPSTSDEVCEMWNGSEIIRVQGNGTEAVKEIIYRDPDHPDHPNNIHSDELLVFTFDKARKEEIYKTKSRRPQNNKDLQSSKWRDYAPNITLNLPTSIKAYVRWCFAIFSVLLQSCIFVFSGLITYHWRLPHPAPLPRNLGFPFACGGTLLLSLGLYMCSAIIKSHTIEETFEENRGTTPYRHRVLRLQDKTSIGSQQFKSFAIFNDESDSDIRTSRRRPEKTPKQQKRHEYFVAFAAGVTLGGYFLQLLGLSGLHWSCSVMQVGANLSMTFVRNWVRRGIWRDVPIEPIPEGFLSSWLSYKVQCFYKWEILCGIQYYHPEVWGVDKEAEDTVGEDDRSRQEVKDVLNHFFQSKSNVGGYPSPGLTMGQLTRHHRPPPMQPRLSRNDGSVKDPLNIRTRNILQTMKTVKEMLGQSGEDITKSKEWGEKIFSAINGIMKSVTDDDRFKKRATLKDFKWTINLLLTYEGKDGGSRRIRKAETREMSLRWSQTAQTAQEEQSSDTITTDLMGSIWLLWRFSLANWTSREAKLRGLTEPEGAPPPDHLDAGSEDSNAVMQYHRIVGNTLRQDESNLQDMIPATVFQINRPNGKKPKGQSVGRTANYPIFGLQFSSMKYPSMNKGAKDFAIDAGTSLDKICALELVSLFLLCVVENIERFSEIGMESPHGEHPSYRYDALGGLARAIKASGITDSEREALTVVVPPFADRNMLRQRESSSGRSSRQNSRSRNPTEPSFRTNRRLKPGAAREAKHEKPSEARNAEPWYKIEGCQYVVLVLVTLGLYWICSKRNKRT